MHDHRIIHTERLVLDDPRPEDLEAFYALRTDPRAPRLYPGRPIETLDQSRELLARVIEENADGRARNRMIRSRRDGSFVGSIGYWRIDPDRKLAEIGYKLVVDHWGQGLMSEALLAFLADADRARPELDSEGWVDAWNVASIRLLLRGGYRPDAARNPDEPEVLRYFRPAPGSGRA
ncbi:MAG: GNAT family N-acetyltransferase [Planctomycetes bacterium]|nr:GNAT family N-acetyltransferase [Planctomycetota bacterium]